MNRLLLIFWLLANSCFASDLPEIICWGNRVGRMVEDIDSSAIETNTASVADLLKQNTAVFVKSYSRSSLSTISLRGMGATHTVAEWNGLNITDPMTGMVDFSTIPTVGISSCSVAKGASAVNSTGALGGVVAMFSNPADKLQASATLGSYSLQTYSLKVPIKTKNSRHSLSFAYSKAENDFHFINIDKKILTDGKRIHPVEVNRHGAYNSIDGLYSGEIGTKILIRPSLWWSKFERNLPCLTVDYAKSDFINKQNDLNLRSSVRFEKNSFKWIIGATYSDIHYIYAREVAEEDMHTMQESDAYATTYQSGVDYFKVFDNHRLDVSANLLMARAQSFNRVNHDGYSAWQFSGTQSTKLAKFWNKCSSSVLLKQQWGGYYRLVPAAFFEARTKKSTIKSSVSYNYKYPSLNDLYFLPGGNPDLKAEHGWSTDLSWSRKISFLQLSTTAHYGKFEDWIQWLPTPRGFFTPRNIKSVRTTGIEMSASANGNIKKVKYKCNCSLSLTSSVNTKAYSEYDCSVGKQLPYVPVFSGVLNPELSWKDITLHYSWQSFSKRHTMSSNDETVLGELPTYFMSNISLSKKWDLGKFNLSISGAVKNLLDEKYVEVLSRPMPGRNYEFTAKVEIK
ncbi:MAG: TonB-dependent receptor [Paludibacteraceae bacterium]|nr:TonB-dependent receptor [Paludibacteraceae bacterium]